MKRVKHCVRRLLQLVKRPLHHIRRIRVSRKVILPAAMLVIGLSIGIWIGHVSAPVRTQQVKKSSPQPASLEQREAKRIEDAYDYGAERIAGDQKAKRITDEEAAKIRSKLDELYNFRKNQKTTTSMDSEREQKRQALRDWAKTNKVSTRYFMRLY